jgi:pectinesterase
MCPKKKSAKTFILTLSIIIKKAIISLVFICLIASYAFTKNLQVVVTVTNPLNLDRPNEMVVIQWNEITRFIPDVNKKTIHVLEVNARLEPAVQIVEENGEPTELLFLVSFRSNETKEFVLTSSVKERPVIDPMTDARYMLPRQDVAWENDRIAHRIYGPALAKESNNGIDVWTKRVRYPIVEKWYRGDETPGAARISYHEDHGEGADFFDVGRSLGDGSCALIEGDSLYQPGVFHSYKILATGPLRAMFEITYNPVRFKSLDVRETKRIILDAGSNLNNIKVTYRCDSSNGSVPFAAGIVKRKRVSFYADKENKYVSLWGAINDREENGALGTGIVMTKNIFKRIKEDNVHVLVLGAAEFNKSITYYAGAGWTRSGDFNTVEEWNKYLKEFSLRVASPLEITIVKK